MKVYMAVVHMYGEFAGKGKGDLNRPDTEIPEHINFI